MVNRDYLSLLETVFLPSDSTQPVYRHSVSAGALLGREGFRL